MMDDGSGKCLLDVINDPSALQEFLRSNSQERKIDSSMTVASHSASVRPVYVNHTVTPTVLNTRSVQGPSVDKSLPTNTTHVPLVNRTLINNTNMPHTSVNKAETKTSNRRSGGLNSSQAAGIGLVPSAVPISTGVNFLKTSTSSSSLATSNGESNRAGVSSVVVSSNVGVPVVGKPVVTSVSSFQGKKPIPIQPKTHNVTGVNNPATVPVQENRLSNVQLINPVVSVVAPKQPTVSQQNTSSIVHNVALNGVDGKGGLKSSTHPGNLSSPKSSPVVTQHSHSTTPVKRIAPKQPNILPQTGVSSSPQLTGTQHKVILPQVTHKITSHIQGAVNQVSSASIPHQNQTQFIHAQQLLNLIRSQTPNIVTTQQQTAQLVQSQSIPANQIRQIQHLVQQKLSGQQQPSIVQQVQQKVLTPAQLQAALKQNQQPGSENQQKTHPQNVVVHEDVISQLIQQFQDQQHQQQPRTPVHGVIQQQQQQQQQQQLQQLQQQQQQIQGVQKQVLLQNVHSLGQQTAPMQVKLSPQVSVQNQRTTASPVSAQIQQIGDLQQKQLQQMLGQQQINVSPQQKLVVTREQATKQVHGMTFAQGQPLRTASPQGLQQGLPQAKPALQQLKAMTTPGLHIVASNPQTVVSDTQQQQAQNVGVQKVFIIKQPELLQKLGLQGNKTQQTIQITPQQLQVLKQIQLQQQTQQKLLGNNTQTGSNVQPKVLTADQLKHLQHQLQSQGVKQVTVQGRTQQQILQQQRQVTVKAQPKMQHIPRILQTTGRQPVSQGAVKVSLPIKQEANKGVKRPHSSDTTEIPKVATRLKQGLLQDQQAVLHPELTTPFASHEDAVKRLAPYHVCYESSPSSADVQKADGLFSTVATQLVKRSQRMMERHRQLLFDESMREHPSAEMVMLYRVFLTDERAALAQERKLAKEELLEIATVSKAETTDEIIPSNQVSPAVITSENTAGKYNSQIPQSALPSLSVKCENNFVRSMKSTDSAASSEDTSYLLNTKISSSPSSSSNVCKTEKGTTSSSLSSKMQTLSSSASSSINHLTKYSPPRIKDLSPLQQSNEHNHTMENSELDNFDSSLDVTEESDMGTEMEKEDVTATLALLNSMASELDEVLDVEGGL